MRRFNDAAYDADDEGWSVMLAAYASHLDSIASRLPPDLAALATAPHLNLHDATLREVSVEPEAGEVMIDATLFDDRRLALRFHGAAVIPDEVQTLAYAVGAEYHTEHWGTAVTVVRAHEVDILDDGRFVLRLRLQPFYEFAVGFRAMELDEAPASATSGRPGQFIVGRATRTTARGARSGIHLQRGAVVSPGRAAAPGLVSVAILLILMPASFSVGDSVRVPLLLLGVVVAVGTYFALRRALWRQ